jgi:hypothetical protein
MSFLDEQAKRLPLYPCIRGKRPELFTRRPSPDVFTSTLYAKWARGIKEQGLATSNHDLVNQAIRALYNHIVNERLKVARLQTLEKAGAS